MQKKFFPIGWFLSLSVFFLFQTSLVYSNDTERIISFDSDINVEADGSMVVTERIKVFARGEQIKRGIYRDFPTQYKDRLGNNYIVDFSIQEILKDGISEDYHTENLSNGVRVYIGNKDVYLSMGEYTYAITYQTNRQIGFFADHDELYWNVTGNGWDFSMDQISATVVLPPGAFEQILEVDGFTGLSGETGKDFEVTKTFDSTVVFRTTRPFFANQGLTILMEWPKGYVKAPTTAQKITYFLKDNRGLLFGILGFVIIMFYYLSAWLRVGRDPARGTIIPLFSPPEGWSPSAVRYLMNRGLDNKVYSAAIINLAVQGFWTVHEAMGELIVTRTQKSLSSLNPEEEAFANVLLGNDKSFTFSESHYAKVIRAKSHLKSLLDKKLGIHQYFLMNRSFFYIGLGLTAGFLLLFVFLDGMNSERVPFLGIFLFGFIFILSKPKNSISIFFIMLRLGMLFLLMSFLMSVSYVLFIGAIVLVNFVFYFLLEAPTIQGRKIMDQVEGFKRFLTVAEGNELNSLKPEPMNLALYEKYLPYAIALDVEKPWSEKMEKILTASGEMTDSYHPSWYVGPGHYNNLGSFSSGLGSKISHSIASSSTPPGSSSGGGGGGHSGGGGGGGGGGGW
jgi:uncharacterized membrane protein YgcG